MKHNKLDGPYSCWFPGECLECKHIKYKCTDDLKPACDAFPNGIPVEIWRDKVSHKHPYPGDHGITYEEAEYEWPPGFDDLVLLDEDELYGEK